MKEYLVIFLFLFFFFGHADAATDVYYMTIIGQEKPSPSDYRDLKGVEIKSSDRGIAIGLFGVKVMLALKGEMLKPQCRYCTHNDLAQKESRLLGSFSFHFLGKECKGAKANFYVHEIVYDSTGNIVRLALDFVLVLPEFKRTLTEGALRYNSKVPIEKKT